MSTKKTKIIGENDRHRRKAIEIVRECREKKFSDKAPRMAEWIGTSATNVDNWCADTTVPAWVIFKIFEQWEDLKEFYLANTSVQEESDRVRKLQERIQRLLKDQFMLDHLETEILICEGYEIYQSGIPHRAHILQSVEGSSLDDEKLEKLNREVSKSYGSGKEPTPTTGDIEKSFGTYVSEEAPPYPEGPATSSGKGRAAHNKK